MQRFDRYQQISLNHNNSEPGTVGTYTSFVSGSNSATVAEWTLKVMQFNGDLKRQACFNFVINPLWDLSPFLVRHIWFTAIGAGNNIQWHYAASTYAQGDVFNVGAAAPTIVNNFQLSIAANQHNYSPIVSVMPTGAFSTPQPGQMCMLRMGRFADLFGLCQVTNLVVLVPLTV